MDDIEAAFEITIYTHHAWWEPTDDKLINMALFVERFEKECLPTFRSLRAQSVSTQNGDRTALAVIVAQKEYKSFLLFLYGLRRKDNHQLILWARLHTMADIFQGQKIAKSALFLGVSSSKMNTQGYIHDAAPGFSETQRTALRSESHLSLSFDN